MTQVMFEEFNVPAMYIAKSAMLSLYASGHTTGVVVESGDGVTQVATFDDAQLISSSCANLEVGGCDFTNYLIRVLGSMVRFHR